MAASRTGAGARKERDRTYRHVFKGSVLINTLLDYDTNRFTNRQAAVKFAQKLLDLGSPTTHIPLEISFLKHLNTYRNIVSWIQVRLRVLSGSGRSRMEWPCTDGVTRVWWGKPRRSLTPPQLHTFPSKYITMAINIKPCNDIAAYT